MAADFLFVYGPFKEGYVFHKMTLNRPPDAQAMLYGYEIGYLDIPQEDIASPMPCVEFDPDYGIPLLYFVNGNGSQEFLEGELYRVTPEELKATDGILEIDQFDDDLPYGNMHFRYRCWVLLDEGEWVDAWVYDIMPGHRDNTERGVARPPKILRRKWHEIIPRKLNSIWKIRNVRFKVARRGHPPVDAEFKNGKLLVDGENVTPRQFEKGKMVAFFDRLKTPGDFVEGALFVNQASVFGLSLGMPPDMTAVPEEVSFIAHKKPRSRAIRVFQLYDEMSIPILGSINGHSVYGGEFRDGEMYLQLEKGRRKVTLEEFRAAKLMAYWDWLYEFRDILQAASFVKLTRQFGLKCIISGGLQAR